MLENLYDCYGKKAMAVYGSWPGVPCQNTGENTQLINSALAIGKITQHNSLFVPMSLQEMYYGKEDAGRKFQHLSYKVFIVVLLKCQESLYSYLSGLCCTPAFELPVSLCLNLNSSPCHFGKQGSTHVFFVSLLATLFCKHNKLCNLGLTIW